MLHVCQHVFIVVAKGSQVLHIGTRKFYKRTVVFLIQVKFFVIVEKHGWRLVKKKRDNQLHERICLLEHIPFTPMSALLLCSEPHQFCHTMPPSSAKYKCLCSTCCGVSKPITSHTIKTHLEGDQDLFKSISGDLDFAISVQLHIIVTSNLLAQLCGSHGAHGIPPGASSSHLGCSEGVFSSVFAILPVAYQYSYIQSFA